mgnify:CR=1 FL=1
MRAKACADSTIRLLHHRTINRNQNAFECWFEDVRNGVPVRAGKVAVLIPPTRVAPITGSISIGESTDDAKDNHVQVQPANVGQRNPALST